MCPSGPQVRARSLLRSNSVRCYMQCCWPSGTICNARHGHERRTAVRRREAEGHRARLLCGSARELEVQMGLGREPDGSCLAHDLASPDSIAELTASASLANVHVLAHERRQASRLICRIVEFDRKGVPLEERVHPDATRARLRRGIADLEEASRAPGEPCAQRRSSAARSRRIAARSASTSWG